MLDMENGLLYACERVSRSLQAKASRQVGVAGKRSAERVEQWMWALALLLPSHYTPRKGVCRWLDRSTWLLWHAPRLPSCQQFFRCQ